MPTTVWTVDEAPHLTLLRNAATTWYLVTFHYKHLLLLNKAHKKFLQSATYYQSWTSLEELTSANGVHSKVHWLRRDDPWCWLFEADSICLWQLILIRLQTISFLTKNWRNDENHHQGENIDFWRNLTKLPILNYKTVALLLFSSESERTFTTAPENVK